MNKEISITDRIFATVTHCGQVLLRTEYSGMTSLADVLAEIKKSLGTGIGLLVKIIIRNYSRGWSDTISILRHTPNEPNTVEAVQLTLF